MRRVSLTSPAVLIHLLLLHVSKENVLQLLAFWAPLVDFPTISKKSSSLPFRNLFFFLLLLLFFYVMTKYLQHEKCEARNQNQKGFPVHKSLKSVSLLRSSFCSILKSFQFSHRIINDSIEALSFGNKETISLYLHVWRVKSSGEEGKKQQSPMCMHALQCIPGRGNTWFPHCRK